MDVWEEIRESTTFGWKESGQEQHLDSRNVWQWEDQVLLDHIQNQDSQHIVDLIAQLMGLQIGAWEIRQCQRDSSGSATWD